MIGVDLVVLEGASPAALGVSIDVVDAVNRLAPRAVFDLRALSAGGPRARARGGVSVAASPLRRARGRDVAVVLGLGAATPAEARARVAAPDVDVAAAWLRKAWRRGATVAASCTGVFVLGASGLLDARRCTTTWWLVPALKEQFPRCLADADAMLAEHDRVMTAGAAFAHIDLMLALTARFAGPSLAEEAARHLVVERRASQARYVVPSFLAARDPVAHLVEGYVRGRLTRPISLDDLAAAAATTPRTLGRRLSAATGLSPMKFVQKIRVDVALHLLQTTRLSTCAVAAEVGFDDASALYRLIVRHTGKSPSQFRAPS